MHKELSLLPKTYKSGGRYALVLPGLRRWEKEGIPEACWLASLALGLGENRYQQRVTGA